MNKFIYQLELDEARQYYSMPEVLRFVDSVISPLPSSKGTGDPPDMPGYEKTAAALTEKFAREGKAHRRLFLIEMVRKGIITAHDAGTMIPVRTMVLDGLSIFGDSYQFSAREFEKFANLLSIEVATRDAGLPSGVIEPSRVEDQPLAITSKFHPPRWRDLATTTLEERDALLVRRLKELGGKMTADGKHVGKRGALARLVAEDGRDRRTVGAHLKRANHRDDPNGTAFSRLKTGLLHR